MGNHFLLLLGYFAIGIVLYSAYEAAEKLLGGSKKTWKTIGIRAGLAVMTAAVASLVVSQSIDNPIVLAIACIVVGLLCSYWMAKLMKVKN